MFAVVGHELPRGGWWYPGGEGVGLALAAKSPSCARSMTSSTSVGLSGVPTTGTPACSSKSAAVTAAACRPTDTSRGDDQPRSGHFQSNRDGAAAPATCRPAARACSDWAADGAWGSGSAVDSGAVDAVPGDLEPRAVPGGSFARRQAASRRHGRWQVTATIASQIGAGR